MPLTAAQARLVADAVLLRGAEQDGRPLWFAGHAADLPELHRLVERGYLHRRVHDNGDLVYRCTDEALKAQALHALTVHHATPN